MNWIVGGLDGWMVGLLDGWIGKLWKRLIVGV
jgi:hypothetical protein